MQCETLVRFCDVCNESVPQVEFDQGRARVHGGSVVCAACTRTESAPESQTSAPARPTVASLPRTGANGRRRARSRARPQEIGILGLLIGQVMVFSVYTVVAAFILVSVRLRYGWSVDTFLDQLIQRFA